MKVKKIAIIFRIESIAFVSLSIIEIPQERAGMSLQEGEQMEQTLDDYNAHNNTGAAGAELTGITVHRSRSHWMNKTGIGIGFMNEARNVRGAVVLAAQPPVSPPKAGFRAHARFSRFLKLIILPAHRYQRNYFGGMHRKRGLNSFALHQAPVVMVYRRHGMSNSFATKSHIKFWNCRTVKIYYLFMQSVGIGPVTDYNWKSRWL